MPASGEENFALVAVGELPAEVVDTGNGARFNFHFSTSDM